jgi:triacylglycerol lipase
MNLVLHHGFFGFANLGDLVYFNGVKAHLTARFPTLRILVTEVAPDGTIQVRGAQLGRQIRDAMSTGGIFDPSLPVHIIAHSMGGLDTRFLLSPDNPDNMADRVKSLTTISSPHKGTPVADVLLGLEEALNISDEQRVFIQTLHAALAQAHIHVGGLRNLTTEGVRRFNERFRDDAGTVKFSVAGTGREMEFLGIPLNTCVALRLPYRIIKERTGEDNDGLVSIGSAAWGEGPELWRADHADEIGHNLDLGPQARPLHFNHLARYEAIVDRLRQL